MKDYVNAKLLFCHPPPGVSEEEFNIPTKENALRRLAGKKKAPVTRVGKGADTYLPQDPAVNHQELATPVEGREARALDASFFAEAGLSSRPFVKGQQFSRSRLYPHQNSVADDGTQISGKHAKFLATLSNNVETAGSKRHFKGSKRMKQRSGKGYD